MIGDRAYESDPLDAELRCLGIERMSLHRRRRKQPKAQDGRKLRRYKWRWKIERLFAWLANFQRLIVRYERRVEISWALCIWGASLSYSNVHCFSLRRA